jgi:hypothetical protein
MSLLQWLYRLRVVLAVTPFARLSRNSRPRTTEQRLHVERFEDRTVLSATNVLTASSALATPAGNAGVASPPLSLATLLARTPETMIEAPSTPAVNAAPAAPTAPLASAPVDQILSEPAAVQTEAARVPLSLANLLAQNSAQAIQATASSGAKATPQTVSRIPATPTIPRRPTTVAAAEEAPPQHAEAKTSGLEATPSEQSSSSTNPGLDITPATTSELETVSPPSSEGASTVPMLEARPALSANLDDLVRARLGLPRASALQRPSVLTDLDSLFLDLWDDEQMLFADAAPQVEEALFPDGIPAIDEMPFPQAAPAPNESSSPMEGPGSAVAAATPANLSAEVAAVTPPRPEVSPVATAISDAGSPIHSLRRYKIAFFLMPFFFASGVSPAWLHEQLVLARRGSRSAPRLRREDRNNF